MSRPAAFTPLNVPRPLDVTPGAGGAPATVTINGQTIAVTATLDSWRIDDEWWRQEISRRYWHVELADGRTLTVFEDLADGGWYAQRYANEPTIAAGSL